MTLTPRERRLVKVLLDVVKDTCETSFENYHAQGWLKLTDKKVPMSGAAIESFKNGAEFGRMMARSAEIRSERKIQELDD